MKTVILNDVSYKIGQNAKENWELLDLSNDYTWFHLKSFPSCHVIIEKEEPDNNEILEGAKLCLENTKYRNLKNIKVNYTKIKNIVKADKVGAVTFKSNRKVNTIMI
jgi:predicted ribosome quality control (RQC) complex YloA/Tae2 family protein